MKGRESTKHWNEEANLSQRKGEREMGQEGNEEETV